MSRLLVTLNLAALIQFQPIHQKSLTYLRQSSRIVLRIGRETICQPRITVTYVVDTEADRHPLTQEPDCTMTANDPLQRRL